MGDKDRTEQPASQGNNFIPMGKRHLIVATPTLLPLLMECLEDGSQVPNFLPLNCTVTGLDVVNVSQPHFVMISMDDIARLA